MSLLQPESEEALTGRVGDRFFLSRAVELGRRGWGQVAPNPMVGCVLVQDGEIVGEGWHEVYGGPHAEVVALAAAGTRARGATAFVSLEPCRHEGKTPPCTKALLAAGVSRVVYGASDPGGDSGGGGADLASSGVEVVGPLFSHTEAVRENPGFFHRSTDRPWIRLKLALSLDSRISAKHGERSFLSGVEATEEVHRLRAGCDAILIGSRTAIVDDPSLTARGKVAPRVPPRRVVLDSRGAVGAEARLFAEQGGEVWILTTEASTLEWRESLGRAGRRIFVLPSDEMGRVELGAALALLAREGVRTILCEGGGVLGSELLKRDAVDQLDLVVAPHFLGEDGVPAFSFGSWGAGAEKGRWIPVVPTQTYGDDLWISLERGRS